MRSKCTMIVFEGPDKVGKQTQSNMLVQYLRSHGYKTALIEVPYDDGITHRMIYWMLRSGLAKSLPNLFQFIQFLNKLLFQSVVLPPLQKNNDYVVFDRWAASAIVYGDATGTNPRFNRWLYNMLKKPDATIILYGPSYKADRVDDSYEKDSQLQRNVREGYLRFASEGEAFAVPVSCVGNKHVVHDRIIKELEAIWLVDAEDDDELFPT